MFKQNQRIKYLLMIILLTCLALSSGMYHNSTYAQSTTTTAFLHPSIAWSPDGTKIAVAGNFGLWIFTKDLQHAPIAFTKNVTNTIAWSPDSSQLAGGNPDGSIQVWDIATSRSVVTLTGHTDSVSSLDWNPDGTELASASIDDTIRIWNVHSRKTRATLQDSDQVWAVRWSPDGKKIATGGGHNTNGTTASTLEIWDAKTATLLMSLSDLNLATPVTSLSWSPDGIRLVSLALPPEIWDTTTGKVLSSYPFLVTDPLVVAWGKDPNKVAGASTTTLQTWDASTGQTLVNFQVGSFVVELLAWNPDGTELVTYNSNGTISTWDNSLGEQVAQATLPLIATPTPTSPSTTSVLTPTVTTTDLKAAIDDCVGDAGLANSLTVKVNAGQFDAFLNEVRAQSGKEIDPHCALKLYTIVKTLLNQTATPTATVTPIE